MTQLPILWLLMFPTTFGDVDGRLEEEPCPFATTEAPFVVLCRTYLVEFIDQLRLHSQVGSAAILNLSEGGEERTFILATEGYAEFFTIPLPVAKEVPVAGGQIVLATDTSRWVTFKILCTSGFTGSILKARADSSFRYAPYGNGVVFVEENNEEVYPAVVPTGALCAAGAATFRAWKQLSLFVERTLDFAPSATEGCADLSGPIWLYFGRRMWREMASK